jgi:hypothetical protein
MSHNYRITTKLQVAMDFMATRGLTQYIDSWSANQWAIRIEMDRANVPDSDLRELKRLFGKKSEDGGVIRMDVEGGYGYKKLTGKKEMEVLSFETPGEMETFTVHLDISNYMVCEEIDVSQGLTDSKWAVVRKRIETGAIPITVCDPVEFQKELDSETL